MFRSRRSFTLPPRRSGLVAVAALLASCLGEAPPAASADAVVSPLRASFERSAAAQRVPVDLLLAISYVDSRFSQRQGEPSRLGGYGLMHLRSGSTLEAAAQAINVPREQLQHDPVTNIEGAAVVLAELARERLGVPPEDLGGWRPVVMDYSGLAEAAPDYARRVFRVLAEGVDGVDDEGRRLVIAPHPELESLAPDGEVGQLQSFATPDYSGSVWKGPCCNYSTRTAAIDMVVIHTCQGSFSGCWGWAASCNPYDVSCHYVVSSNGEVYQICQEYQKAWHASCVNSRAIGIEHEGFVADPARWYTDKMYCASAKLVRSICDRNRIPCDRAHVIGHVEANRLYCGGNHYDPGTGWDWTKFMSYVNGGCGGATTGTLTGAVYKAPDTNARIAGATVKLSSGQTATTGADGVYKFTLAPGNYTVTASKTGYQSASVTRAVTAATTVWGSLGLHESTVTGNFKGSVYEYNAAAPSDASKKLTSAQVSIDGGAFIAVRATDALFSFAVPPGSHTVTAKLTGYQQNSSTRTVVANADVWGSIALSPVGTAVPPKVHIESPPDDLQLEVAHVDIQGTLENANGVTEVVVKFAGQQVSAPVEAGRFEASIVVPAGDTKIDVTATNTAGSGFASVTVHFKTGVCGYVHEQETPSGGGDAVRVSGASIKLVPAADSCGAAAATRTSEGAEGRFCFDIAPGEYLIRATKDGYGPLLQGVVVTEDLREQLALALPPPSSTDPTLELIAPEPGADGVPHVIVGRVDLVGRLVGMAASTIVVAGQAVELNDERFAVGGIDLQIGDNEITWSATAQCGERADGTFHIVRDPLPAEAAGVRGSSCGCSVGAEAPSLWALAALVAWARRRRRS